MNTIVDTARVVSAVVTGARHARGARNGQDAAVTLVFGDIAVAVVCDGCSSGASSEVGARLGAMLVARALIARLARGERAADPETWTAVRAEVVAMLRLIADNEGHASDGFVRDHLLFTIVAAALTRDEAAVWAIGDGAYVVDGETRTLGPFANNEPPYLAYDLFDEARPAHFEILPPATRTIVIATDGALDLAETLDGDLGWFAAARFLAHPDALRRQLAILARAEERIDWDERRIVRTPAPLQDDCAIAIVQRIREVA